MASGRQFPGGLRAQLVLGLCLMLLGTFALVLVTVENVLARQVRESAQTEAAAIAELAERALSAGASPEEVVSDRVVAIQRVDSKNCWGSRCTLAGERVGSDGLLSRGGEWYAVVESKKSRVVVSLPWLEARRERARGFLWPFFLIDAIFVLALAYGFFTWLIMRPLRAIGVASVRASEGDFASPIKTLPRNEFGEVGRSFNDMLRRIDEGREALESKVREIQQANERLASTQASLIRSEKLASVGHLAAGIAHEVGNPLAAVSGYVELLADAELDADERADLLERSTRQLERIRSIIRNLLDYSRADRSVERIPCELRTVAEDAVALVEAIPRARGKRFSVRGEAMAYTFPAHVVQVLVNLLVNAVDAYGDKPGEVRVELEQTKSSARVAVHDDASGMDEDELSRIFEPFYTTKDPGEGTGLGLSICQRIVEDLDGTLNVESYPGEGTVFTLEFPVPPSEEP